MRYQLPGSITRDGRPIPGGADINATDYAFAGRIYPRPGHDIISDREYKQSQQDEWPDTEDVQEEEIEEAVQQTLVKTNGVATEA